MKIVAIIPARGGSKRVLRKNIRPLAGNPLLHYAIAPALENAYVDRVIVSSDDDEIMAVARELGAEVPFRRPTELATDSASGRQVLQHALRWLENEDDFVPDFVLNLQCTTPFKTSADISGVVEKWLETGADSVRSMSLCSGVHHPYWMFSQGEDGLMVPFIEGISIDTYYRSQLLPPAYRLNGVVDGIRRSVVMDHEHHYGSSMAMVEIPEERSLDIDTEMEFRFAEFLMEQNARK